MDNVKKERFTPGPWLSGAKYISLNGNETGWVVETAGGTPVAETDGLCTGTIAQSDEIRDEGGCATNRFNGYLIAMAPDMYAMLAAVLRDLSGSDCLAGYEDDIRSVLSKARGVGVLELGREWMPPKRDSD